jgi:hypothetical protein
MLEPHQSQFVVRVETMTDAERRVADEQAAIMAWTLWKLGRGAARRARALRLRALSMLGAHGAGHAHQGEPVAEDRARAACPDPCPSPSTASDVL